MKPKTLKEKIIKILREVMSSSENRDWGRESHATKQELETMRNNNDNDFLQIATDILELFSAEKETPNKMEEEIKSPQQVINEAREENVTTTKRSGLWHKIYYVVKQMPREECCDDAMDYPSATTGIEEIVLSWHTSTLKAFIGAEIKRLEGMKKYTCMAYQDSGIQSAIKDGWNQALQDQITHLKQLKL